MENIVVEISNEVKKDYEKFLNFLKEKYENKLPFGIVLYEICCNVNESLIFCAPSIEKGIERLDDARYESVNELLND